MEPGFESDSPTPPLALGSIVVASNLVCVLGGAPPTHSPAETALQHKTLTTRAPLARDYWTSAGAYVCNADRTTLWIRTYAQLACRADWPTDRLAVSALSLTPELEAISLCL